MERIENKEQNRSKLLTTLLQLTAVPALILLLGFMPCVVTLWLRQVGRDLVEVLASKFLLLLACWVLWVLPGPAGATGAQPF